MSRKPRLTTFARFIIFLIIIVPTAFVVSHLANNDWQFDKNVFLQDLGLKEKTEMTTDDAASETETNQPTTDNSGTETNVKDTNEDGNASPAMEKRVEELEKQLEEMQMEMKALKDKIESLGTNDNLTTPTESSEN